MPEPEGNNVHQKRFILIGAGNVGFHLCTALVQNDYIPVQIINRSPEKARQLAEITGCSEYSGNLRLNAPADFILICVNDDSLKEVVSQIEPGEIPVFHTSGSTPINIFNGSILHHGVIYPLQTFSKERKVQMDQVPFLIEASDAKTLEMSYSIASDLGKTVIEMDSKERLKYHIAAVFACNFTNYFLSLSFDYLRKNELSDEILVPLVRETFQKFMESRGKDVQTGPAVREDRKTLRKHEEMLKTHPHFQKIYTFVSESIIDYKKDKETE